MNQPVTQPSCSARTAVHRWEISRHVSLSHSRWMLPPPTSRQAGAYWFAVKPNGSLLRLSAESMPRTRNHGLPGIGTSGFASSHQRSLDVPSADGASAPTVPSCRTCPPTECRPAAPLPRRGVREVVQTEDDIVVIGEASAQSQAVGPRARARPGRRCLRTRRQRWNSRDVRPWLPSAPCATLNGCTLRC